MLVFRTRQLVIRRPRDAEDVEATENPPKTTTSFSPDRKCSPFVVIVRGRWAAPPLRESTGFLERPRAGRIRYELISKIRETIVAKYTASCRPRRHERSHAARPSTIRSSICDLSRGAVDERGFSSFSRATSERGK